jgi:peroxidase
VPVAPQSADGCDLTVPLDVLTLTRLDNKYCNDLKHHHGLLASDQTLLSSSSTAGIVKEQCKAQCKKFAVAMVKMRSIDV